jgi:hypothetical protein
VYLKKLKFVFNRQIVGQSCGWSNIDSKSGEYDRMSTLLEQDEYEKVAAIYIFQMNVNKALEILNDGLQRGLSFFLFFFFLFKINK